MDLWCRGVHARASISELTENEVDQEVAPSALSATASCVQNLVDAIVDDAELESSVADGVAATEITTAGYQSAKTRGFIDLPLADDRHPMIADDEQIIDGYLD
jgi:hypothetical protein